MLFDTDILIWIQHGNEAAADLVQKVYTRYISIQTYMELLQTAQNKKQQKDIRDFLSDFSFTSYP